MPSRKSYRKRSSVGSAKGLIIPGFPGYFLVACILIAGAFMLKVFWPFITTLIFAAILATAFFPLYKKVRKLFNKSEKLASLTTCGIVLVLIIVPLFIFVLLLGKQASDTVFFVQGQIQEGVLDSYLLWDEGGVIYDALGDWREPVEDIISVNATDIRDSIAGAAGSVTSFIAEQSGNLIKGFGWLLISLFILVFSMYYLFKDHKEIVRKIMTLSPLPNEHEEELFRKFKEISLATLYGIFLTAIAQGIIGGVGFFIAGVPSPVFWGTAVALFSLVPVLGTSIVWVPASIFLLVTGNIFGGLFLFFWGLLIVSTVDNFLRAYLIGEKTKMNQLLMFLAVFGGIWAFGLIGVIFGPLILTFFFAFLHIYESEYDKVLHRK